MNFLLLQDLPLPNENIEKFSIARCFERAFGRHNFSSKVLRSNNVNAYQEFNFIKDSYNILFITQNYSLDNIQYVNEFNGLKIFWSIDSHKDLHRHLEFVKNNNIDVVLVSGFDYLNKFKEVNNDSFYFPNCYPLDLIQPTQFKNRPIDIGFCGSKSNRSQWLTMLAQNFNMDLAINVPAESMVNKLTSYKISFNRNESNDLNFRTFESTGAGTLLLTNKIGGIDLCFDLDQDISVYTTEEECIYNIKYYLGNEKSRLAKAMNGFTKARKKHTFDSRVTELIRIITLGDK